MEFPTEGLSEKDFLQKKADRIKERIEDAAENLSDAIYEAILSSGTDEPKPEIDFRVIGSLADSMDRLAQLYGERIRCRSQTESC